MYGEYFLNVNPSLEVVWDPDVLRLCFSLKCSCIEITTRHEDELTTEDAFLTEESMSLLQCILYGNTCIDLLLSDTRQLSAKVCKLGVNSGLHVCLEY